MVTHFNFSYRKAHFGHPRLFRYVTSGVDVLSARLTCNENNNKHINTPTRYTNSNLYNPPVMQEFDEREESPMPILPAYGILATLTHVKRQNGQDLNTFPIDSEKVTIGR